MEEAVGVVIAAGGSSSRMQSFKNKVLLSLQERPVLAWSVEAFLAVPEVQEVVVVTREADVEPVRNLAAQRQWKKVSNVVVGGTERQASVLSGLQALAPEHRWVAVHDGARPLVTERTIAAVLSAAKQTGAAAAGVPVTDTVKQVERGLVQATLPRERLWAVHTPQIFRRDWLEEAHEQALLSGYVGTDDCSLVEQLGFPVQMVPGNEDNLKITKPQDLILAEALIRSQREPVPDSGLPLVGMGVDVHGFASDRELVLGGVHIPDSPGLAGHSDADVAVHALMDAILGAGVGGDIGSHFPDTDPQYKGISSLGLLKRVMERLAAKGLVLANASITVVAQTPRLAPHIPAMRTALAPVLNVALERINIGATTTEGLGFVGRKEGIAAFAVVSLTRAVDTSL